MTPKTSAAIEVLFSAIGRIRAGGKKVANELFDLDLLQAIEIPQNHQRILWKSFALDPEKFGKARIKLGGPDAASRRLQRLRLADGADNPDVDRLAVDG